jgi:hypothetical protein
VPRGGLWRAFETVVKGQGEKLQSLIAFGRVATRPALSSQGPQPEERVSPRSMISFADRATIPSNVLIRFLDQESVLLNLNSERYFGLDSVGTRMWQLLTAAPTIDAAYCQLIEEFDVDSKSLRSDLSHLLDHLIENGLIATQPVNVGAPSTV